MSTFRVHAAGVETTSNGRGPMAPQIRFSATDVDERHSSAMMRRREKARQRNEYDSGTACGQGQALRTPKTQSPQAGPSLA